jgi:hypothetical protein
MAWYCSCQWWSRFVGKTVTPYAGFCPKRSIGGQAVIVPVVDVDAWDRRPVPHNVNGVRRRGFGETIQTKRPSRRSKVTPGIAAHSGDHTQPDSICIFLTDINVSARRVPGPVPPLLWRFGQSVTEQGQPEEAGRRPGCATDGVRMLP